SSALRVLEVQREAFLVSIDAQEVRTFAVYKRRTPRTRIVAEPRPLDLDDSGAHVRELHGAVGSGEHPAEIQDGDPFERTSEVSGMIHGEMLYRCSRGNPCHGQPGSRAYGTLVV